MKFVLNILTVLLLVLTLNLATGCKKETPEAPEACACKKADCKLCEIQKACTCGKADCKACEKGKAAMKKHMNDTGTPADPVVVEPKPVAEPLPKKTE